MKPPCSVCGKNIEKLNGGKNWENKKYCSRICKNRAYDNKRRLTPEYKDYAQKYHKKWYLKNRERVITYQQTYQKNSITRKEYAKMYMRLARKNPDYQHKNLVRNRTNYYFQKWKKKGVCDVCEEKNEKLEFHHIRYILPIKREDVLVVCKRCHCVLDKRRKV